MNKEKPVNQSGYYIVLKIQDFPILFNVIEMRHTNA